MEKSIIEIQKKFKNYGILLPKTYTPMEKILLFNLQEVKKAQLTLRAINNKMRTKILELLVNKELNVTQIYVALKIEQSVASQHLGILRRSRIVKTKRTGKVITYSLNYEKIVKLKQIVKMIDY